jgi:palmitoyl-protein thioesterase
MGVSDLPTCRPGDVLCQIAHLAARRGVYSSYAQNNIVQAQYFRDPRQLPAYFKHNKFLTTINGELSETRNETFKKNLSQLEHLVLVLFDADTTVVPRESSWFGSIAPPQEDPGTGQVDVEGWRDPTEIIPMRMQELYKYDWIGLRTVSPELWRSAYYMQLILYEPTLPAAGRK